MWQDGLPVATVQGAAIRYALSDHLGTARQLDNASGTAVWSWSLLGSTFGETAANEDPDGDSIATRHPLRFPGQYADSESGLSYNYFRDYEPGTGRYVESDPIGLNGGLNTYRYAYANALKYLDPYGLSSCTTLFCLPGVSRDVRLSSSLTEITPWVLENIHVEPYVAPPAPPTRLAGIVPLPIHLGNQIATCFFGRAKVYTDLYQTVTETHCLEACFGQEECGGGNRFRWRNDVVHGAMFENIRREREQMVTQIMAVVPALRCLQILGTLH